MNHLGAEMYDYDRRTATEKLTKQWLMGVRRGWLSLMKPSISDYNSVMKAIDKLVTFAKNLQDQVYFLRRGVSSFKDLPEGQRLEKLFTELEKGLYEASSRARGWKEWADGTALGYQWGEDRSADAQKMLDLYRRDFDDATSGSVHRRGGGGLYRPQSLTEIIDKILAILRADANLLKNQRVEFTPDIAYKEFDLGGMKVIVDDSTVNPTMIKQYITHLSKTKALLQRAGFSKIWKGTIFVKCKQCGGENQYGAELGVGGHYLIDKDTINIYNRPSDYVVEIVLHELGHRWWFKHISRENRLRFEEWIEGGLSPVSGYGGKHFSEAFAEVFAWYCLGRELTSQQLHTFKMIALNKRLASLVETYSV